MKKFIFGPYGFILISISCLVFSLGCGSNDTSSGSSNKTNCNWTGFNSDSSCHQQANNYHCNFYNWSGGIDGNCYGEGCYNCGYSSSQQTISYDTSNSNDWVTCNNASKILKSTPGPNDARHQTCFWYCGSGYKGYNNAYVRISFKSASSTSPWTFESDYINWPGSCN